MTITYRTAGPWGVGLGADLSAVQVDNNFWDLHGRVEILEAWPTPAAIESFTIDGNQMTVVMDDATTHGPYTLPTYVPSAFEWAPGMDVVPGQMFSINSTIYTVVYPHTTVDPFDPGENDGGGNDYYQEFITVDGVLPAGGATGQALVKLSSTDYAVTWASVGVPAGGTTGQVHKKTSGTDYDTAWYDNDLDGLSDVTLGTPADGDFLRYSASGTVWAAETFDALEVADVGVSVQPYDAQLSSLVRQNSQSANYTAVLTDGGYHILHPAADNNPRTFTIPANASVAFPIGTALSFVNEINAVTIAITTDTMVLAGAGTTGSRTLAANGIATALKITSTKWIVSGNGLT